jgi:hypothetical protein
MDEVLGMSTLLIAGIGLIGVALLWTVIAVVLWLIGMPLAWVVTIVAAWFGAVLLLLLCMSFVRAQIKRGKIV